MRYTDEILHATAISACLMLLCAVVLYSRLQAPPKQPAAEHSAPAHKQAHANQQTNIPTPPLSTMQPKTSQEISPFAAQPSWSQDFSTAPDGPLDPAAWNIDTGNDDGWGNDEAEYYTARSKNVGIRDHALVIQAFRENYQGSDYTSARIQTENKFDFAYGRLQIVAKLPTGKGIWPAIWLWPTDNLYGSQPLAASEQDNGWLANGEIDIVEGGAQGDDQFSASAHAVNHYPNHAERTGFVTIADPSETYHTYGLDWTHDSLVFSVDGQAFYSVSNPHTTFKDWPYDQKYHLILNVALGGVMSQNLQAELPPYGIDDDGAPWAMSVKSITYYPLAQP